MNNEYIPDSPLCDPQLDSFKRWPFAQRIAQTIASRQDTSSLVIGLYGAWGEGKSTVLNFLERELKNHQNVVCIRFNPWQCKDESTLLHLYFNTLANSLERSISSTKEKIGEIIAKYATMLSPISAIVGIGQSLPEVGSALASVSLDESKKRIEKVLLESKKHIVVLIDDIDRLDKKEVQAIFKMVKVCADFSCTTYVLAFDEEMVAAAVAEQYASGNIESGRNFLEKIVQVPLHLPKASPASLRKFCLDGIGEALNELQIALTEEQCQHFGHSFMQGLEIRVQTPRMCKRYKNTLMFALPLLKGEANTVELMLIEGIRVFYPKVYEVIRENPDVFVGSDFKSFSNNRDELKKRYRDILDKGFEGLSLEEKKAAQDLLLTLFPRLNEIYNNTHYGNDWEETWQKEQSIASKHYFSRFFSYSISADDIPDSLIKTFLLEIENQSKVDEIIRIIQNLVTINTCETFLFKIRHAFQKLSAPISYKLALAISKLGSLFPTNESFSFSLAPSDQAACLVRKLLDNITNVKDRFSLAKAVANEGEPLEFAIECFTWMRSKKREEHVGLLSEKEEEILGKVLAKRVKIISQKADKPLYIEYPQAFRAFMWVWFKFSAANKIHQYLRKTFKQETYNVVEFLKCYLPQSLGLVSGRLSKGSLRREQYNDIIKYINPKIIYNTLYKLYGKKLDTEQNIFDQQDVSLEERTAYEFANLYHFVQKEQSKPDAKNN